MIRQQVVATIISIVVATAPTRATAQSLKLIGLESQCLARRSIGHDGFDS